MKTKSNLILAAALIACGAVSASAAIQQTQTPQNENTYSRLNLSYDLTTFKANDEIPGYFGPDEDSRKLNGFGVEYLYGVQLTKSIPFYGELGLRFHMGFWNNEEYTRILNNSYKETSKMQYMTIAMPINFGYRIEFTDQLSLQPYVGINLKFNVMARTKTTYDEAYFKDFKEYGIHKYDDAYDWISYLSDKKEGGMGSTDNTWEIFQVGWHAGLGFNLGDLYLGVNYGTDFIPVFNYKKAHVNTSTLNVTLGFNI